MVLTEVVIALVIDRIFTCLFSLLILFFLTCFYSAGKLMLGKKCTN